MKTNLLKLRRSTLAVERRREEKKTLFFWRGNSEWLTANSCFFLP